MNTSPQIDKIVPALIAVKSELQAVTKSASNPFFKSKYASLDAHLEAVEPLLAKNGLVLIQPTGIHPNTGKGTVSSILMHVSGQFVTSIMELAAKDPTDCQKLGSSVTYFRRYTLGALLGMSAVDDDGEDAVGRTKLTKQASVVVPNGVSVGVATANSAAGVALSNSDTTIIAPKRSSFRKSVTAAQLQANTDDI